MRKDPTPDPKTAKPPNDKAWIATARESFSGRLLTDRQFSDALALTGILHREVLQTGSFKDKLGDYAFAFARSERFDAMKAETIIRDLFRERFGQTMNQLREARMAREAALTEDDRALALGYAIVTGEKVAQGDKLTFHRALTSQAKRFGDEIGITHAKARSLMAESYEASEGRSLADWGKELDERFYRAQLQAEGAARQVEHAGPAADETASPPARSFTRARDRTGPST